MENQNSEESQPEKFQTMYFFKSLVDCPHFERNV